MQIRDAITTFSQSEKIKGGLIWTSQAVELFKALPEVDKPGAEKICGMLGLIPRFPNLDQYEQAVIGGSTLKMIILKCELHTGSDFVAAEGTGARRIAQDNGDINKSLKMTEKSAHIDATLRVAGLSELFGRLPPAPPPGHRPGAGDSPGRRVHGCLLRPLRGLLLPGGTGLLPAVHPVHHRRALPVLGTRPGASPRADPPHVETIARNGRRTPWSSSTTQAWSPPRWNRERRA